jgi:peptidyl-prolyl cis-trans isomerase D
MFDLFRSRDKSVRILLGVILGLVALSMVWYLVPTGNQGLGTDESVLATVDDQRITIQDAQKALAAQMRGRQVPPELLGYFAPQIVQSMVNQRAEAYEAERLGLRVSDDDVVTAIRAQLPPQFIKKDGSIDEGLLGNALGQQGVTVDQYIDAGEPPPRAHRSGSSCDQGLG